MIAGIHLKTRKCPRCGRECYFDAVFEIWVCECCRWVERERVIGVRA